MPNDKAARFTDVYEIVRENWGSISYTSLIDIMNQRGLPTAGAGVIVEHNVAFQRCDIDGGPWRNEYGFEPEECRNNGPMMVVTTWKMRG